MTYAQAVKTYIKHGKNKRWIVSCIQRWNPKDTIGNNARALKISYCQSQNVCKFYELAYKLDVKGSRIAKRRSI